MASPQVRRHNPYSFDTSRSSSFETPLQITADARHHAAIMAAAAAVSPPYIPQTPVDAATFDVHSDCSDEHYLPCPRRDTKIESVVTQPRRHQCSYFDAAEMAELLALAGHPVDMPCAPGYVLTVYNSDISQHFNVRSEDVQITRGSIKYADHHARYGTQTRFRFQLCDNYRQGKCAKLSECSYLHVTALPRASEVHLNPFTRRRLAADRRGHSEDVPLSFQDDPNVVAAYQTLPAGRMLKIYAPNDNGQLMPQMIPSDLIILTVGAVAAYGAGNSEHCHHRHCAHYQFKRLCNLGRECHFIHSKVPFLGSSPLPAAQQQQQQFQSEPTRYGPVPV